MFYNLIKDIFIPGVAVLVSIIALRWTQNNVPDYIVISKNGEVLSKKGFKKYGLFVEKKEIKENKSNKESHQHIF